MRRTAAAALTLLLGLAALPGAGQAQATAPALGPAPLPTPAQPQVLIIDSERLFSETLYGRRLAAELAAAAAALQAENDAIVAELQAEERSLTERRPAMAPAAFRTAAEAFDEKVQALRRERDARTQDLQRQSAESRTAFETEVQSVIADMMIERGAVVVLEQRSVVMSIRAANITDEAITRIDAALGDGTR